MDKSGRTAFGLRLAQARKHAKLTQINTAKAVKMSQGTLAELEMEGSGSSYTAQLAGIYGVDPTWLATGKGEMNGGGGASDADQAQNETSLSIVQNKNENVDLVHADEIIELIALYQQSNVRGRTNILSFARTTATRGALRWVRADADKV